MQVDPKVMKKCLTTLKSILTWAVKDSQLGEPMMKMSGNKVSYSSLEGLTAGVIFPMDLGFVTPRFVSVRVLKSAIAVNPTGFEVDHIKCTINGVKYSVADSDKYEARMFVLDVNDTFGTVKPVLTVPIPEVLPEVSVAQGKQDIRWYLNGVCFDLGAHTLLATDGHRMHIANSTTLPEFPAEKLALLRRQDPGADANAPVKPVQVVLASWQIQLLKAIGASEFKVGMFPVRPKDATPLKGWKEPSGDTPLIRAKGEHGFLIGRAVDGMYPDWVRVSPSVEALEAERAVLKTSESTIPVLEEKLKLGYSWVLASQLNEAKEWKSRYARTIKFLPGTSEAIEAHRKACKMADVKKDAPFVVLDLKNGVIREASDSAISLEVKFELVDDFPEGYSDEREEHLVGINCQYLAEGLKYMGEAPWFVRKASSCVSHQGVKSAVVMTCKA